MRIMEDRQGAAPAAGSEKQDWSLSLVIPAYNEAAGIAQAVAEADDALARLADDYEILVVDDGSTDTTADAVIQCARSRPRVHLLRHATNHGYGAALRTGFEAASLNRVAFTDADGQFDLADLARLVPLADSATIVVGYRAERQDPWLRRFYSWGYNRIIRLLLGTGVRDCDCALKVFRREALAHLLPETRGFFVNTEMLSRARQLGMSVEECRVRHRPRRHGVSKVSLREIPRTLATLLPFWWSRSLFPRSETPAAQPADRAAGTGALLLVLLFFAALLFFWHLESPLQEPDEARYAEVPRQMLAESTLAGAGAARPGLLRQAAALLLAGDGLLPALRRPRLGGTPGIQRFVFSGHRGGLVVGTADAWPACRARRGAGAARFPLASSTWADS